MADSLESPQCQKLIAEIAELWQAIKRSRKDVLENSWRVGRRLEGIKSVCGAGRLTAAILQIGIPRSVAHYNMRIASLEFNQLGQFKNRSDCLRHLCVKFTGHRLKKHDDLRPKEASLNALEYIKRSTDPAKAAAMTIQIATEFLAKWGSLTGKS